MTGTETITETILDRLVAFPSVCGQSNTDMIGWIAAHLAALGARVRRIPGDRPDAFSLFASVGPDIPGGIVLSAHSDVVPAAGQAWSSDPFVLTKRDDRLYGRGTSDMKGFLACMLTAAGKAAARPLVRPLHLVISHDEELGCLGVRSLLAALKTDAGMRDAAGCIIGEPTEMAVAVAHKGKIAFRIVCRGEAAHSADPFRGTNAIVLAAQMIGRLTDLQDHIRLTEPHDTRFAVPFSTVQAGLIEGGTALNIVPDLCVATAEMRLIPGQDGSASLAWLDAAARRVEAEAGRGTIRIDIVNAYPGLDGRADTEICALGLRAAGRNAPGVIDFGTEAGLFAQQLGLPCIVCGPGSIGRAHKADEYITTRELAQGDRFLDGVLDRLRR